MSEEWTIRAALEWTQGYLERKGDENPLVSAQWLLTDALGMSRVELYTNYDRPLTMPERDVLRDYVARRGAGEPLQYITGEVGFRHIAIRVKEGVLIPRPETEVLVSEGLALLPPLEKKVAFDSRQTAFDEEGEGEGAVEGEPEAATAGAARNGFAAESAEGAESTRSACVLVADICTGSGCIACSVAYEYPPAHVIATDIEPKAVALAQENAGALGLEDRIEVIECDLAGGIPERYKGEFDLVISNPPYIPTEELSGLPSEVSNHEPALALDGGADGLSFYRRVLGWSIDALKPGGALAVELHEACLDQALSEAEAAGFVSAAIVFDLAERPRVLKARKPLKETDEKGDDVHA